MRSDLLNDAVVLVTGAARGLGRAMAFALVEAGARVVAMDLPNGEQLSELSAEAERRNVAPRLLAIGGDVTREADCVEAVAAAIRKFGGLHGVVNNAGLGMQDIGAVLVGNKTKFYEVDVARWRATMDVNINGAFLVAKAAVPHLIRQGKGRIVNITTSHITMSWGGGSPYGPSKAALEVASTVWAKDLAGTGVTVNVLIPGGPADTRMIPDNEVSDRATLVQPAAMGPPLVWLMSKGSDGISGFRFSAKDWNSSLEPIEAARRAGSRAGW